MVYKVISPEYLINLISYLQDLIIKKLDKRENRMFVEEISKNLFILVENRIDIYRENEAWIPIESNIRKMIELDKKTNPGLTNKTIFQHMDMLGI